MLAARRYGNQIGSASFQVQPNSAGSFTAPQSYTSNGRSYTLMAGQSAGLVKAIEPAAVIIEDIIATAVSESRKAARFSE